MGLTNNIQDSTTKFVSIDDFFKRDILLFIPEYQRTYSWKNNNIEDFNYAINQLLFEQFNSKSREKKQFFGTIMLSSDIKKQEYEVVDGQQRLTTFFILIKVLIDLLQNELNSTKKPAQDSSSIINSANSLIFDLNKYAYHVENYDYFNYDQKKILKIKFTNQKDTDDFNNFFKDIEKNKKVSYFKKKITKNYNLIKESVTNFIQDEMDNKKTLLERITSATHCIINNVYFLELNLKDTSNAFAIFDSMNSTGLPLSPFDLVNGFITTKLENEKSNLKEIWIERMKFWRDNEVKLDDYVFWWLNSKKEDVPKVNVYKSVKKIVSIDKIENVASEIIQNFEYLYDFFNKNNFLFLSNYIKLLNRKKIMPVFLALKSKNYKDEKILDIMIKLVKYSTIEYNFFGTSPGSFQYKIRSIIDLINESEENSVTFDSIKTLPKIIDDFNTYKEKDIFEKLSQNKINDDQLMKCIFYMKI